MDHHRLAVQELLEMAMEMDKGIVLATRLVDMLRARAVLLHRLNAIERVCAVANTRADRRIYKQLTDGLTDAHLGRLDNLLTRREEDSLAWLGWLRSRPSSRSQSICSNISIGFRCGGPSIFPMVLDVRSSKSSLVDRSRGRQMTSADIVKFEKARRYATLVALAVEGRATITDEVIGLHDRIVGKLFNIAKHKHKEQSKRQSYERQAQTLWSRRLSLARSQGSGGEPFAAIEILVSWEDFAVSFKQA